MRVTATSDWRDGIPFETPVLVADLIPGEPTRCSVCGVNSEPLPRTELWAIKHQHPNHHSGHVRFYCRTHLPVIQRAAPVSSSRPERRERRAPARRPAVADAAPRAMCPDCFVEVSATGVCGMCGRQIG